jgi:hypothetical protein
MPNLLLVDHDGHSFDLEGELSERAARALLPFRGVW